MQEFKAIAYNDAWEDGRESGVLTLSGTTLTFTSGEHSIVLYKNDVVLDHGGTGNRQVFIRSKSGDISFSTGDKAILSHPFFDYHPRLQEQKRKAVSNFRQAKIFLGIGLAAIILFFASIFYNRSLIVRKLASTIPYGVEQSLGKSYITQLSMVGDIDSTSEAAKTLSKQVKLITDHIDKSYDFKVFVSKDSVVNAYALPGGYMVFNEGLLHKADSWEEVLGVAAHEAAHVTEKHHARGIFSRFGIWTLVSMLVGDGSFLVDAITAAGANLEGLTYSREYETESDTKGFEYLQMAKINPNGLRTFFSKLADEHKDDVTSSIPEFLSTHPSNDKRIENIKQMESNNINKDFVSLPSYSAFKEMLKTDDIDNKGEESTMDFKPIGDNKSN
jgi:Zn-dependent protease with chaperone function